MKSILSLGLVIMVVLRMSSCNSDSPTPQPEINKLPPETSSGKHTFGCLVNDEAFVPYTQVDIYATYQSGILQISAELDNPKENDPIEFISLILIEQGTDFLTTGTYELTNPPMRKARCLIDECNYDEEYITSGKVTITRLDRNNLIVAGTFELKAQAPGCSAISITEGRFDIKYVP